MERLPIFSPPELRNYIEFLRNELIDKGLKLGLNNEKTVLASKELDYFIYQYQLLEAPKRSIHNH